MWQSVARSASLREFFFTSKFDGKQHPLLQFNFTWFHGKFKGEVAQFQRVSSEALKVMDKNLGGGGGGGRWGRTLLN